MVTLGSPTKPEGAEEIKILPNILKYSGVFYQKTIRKFLPEYGYTRRNGVIISRKRIFDDLLPRHFHPHPPKKSRYKDGNVSLLNNHLMKGDDVISIGGGYGVTAITASRLVGDAGSITVYEASERQANIIQNVIELNGESNNIELIHGLVGKNVHVYDGMGDPKQVHPAELSDVDVIEMDCEGSEISILNEMNITPRCMIIELHPHRYGEPYNKGIQVIEDLGYEIVDVVDQYGETVGYERFKKLMYRDSSDELIPEFTEPFIAACMRVAEQNYKVT